MDIKNIAFIGGGNMAHSIIGGLLKNHYPAENIWVSDPNEEKRQSLRAVFSVNTTDSNDEAINQADVIVLAIKPQIAKQVLQAASSTLQANKPLIVSIMAGVRASDIQAYCGDSAVIRTIPNTPALLGCGVTGLYATNKTSESEKNFAENIMRAVGVAIWLDSEEKIDTVTALASSGIAYFFYVMEVMQLAGEHAGLSPEESKIFVLEAGYGAARMALESKDDVVKLRKNVTSPNGTTEQGVKVLIDGGLKEIFQKTIMAAKNRAKELSEEFSKKE